PPGARRLTVEVAGWPVEAFAEGERLVVNWQSVPSRVRTDLPQLAAALRRPAAPGLPAAEAFAGRSYPRIADTIPRDPGAFRKGLNDFLAAEFRRNAELWKQGRIQELQDRIALLETSLDDLPELRIQKALGEIASGRAEAAARALDSRGPPRALRQD